jgi:hypothetical protein
MFGIACFSLYYLHRDKDVIWYYGSYDDKLNYEASIDIILFIMGISAIVLFVIAYSIYS